jgi:hypothetical protein
LLGGEIILGQIAPSISFEQVTNNMLKEIEQHTEVFVIAGML